MLLSATTSVTSTRVPTGSPSTSAGRFRYIYIYYLTTRASALDFYLHVYQEVQVDVVLKTTGARHYRKTWYVDDPAIRRGKTLGMSICCLRLLTNLTFRYIDIKISRVLRASVLPPGSSDMLKYSLRRKVYDLTLWYDTYICRYLGRDAIESYTKYLPEPT